MQLHLKREGALLINWEDYSPYQSSTPGRLNRELTRRQAEIESKRLLEHKSERIDAVVSLLHRNGFDVDTSPTGLSALDSWYFDHVEFLAENPSQPRSLYYSLAHDLGLLVGDYFISLYPNLQWAIATRPKVAEDYQSTVVTNFSRSDYKYFRLDPAWQLARYAERAINGPARTKAALPLMLNAVQKYA